MIDGNGTGSEADRPLCGNLPAKYVVLRDAYEPASAADPSGEVAGQVQRELAPGGFSSVANRFEQLEFERIGAGIQPERTRVEANRPIRRPGSGRRGLHREGLLRQAAVGRVRE